MSAALRLSPQMLLVGQRNYRYVVHILDRHQSRAAQVLLPACAPFEQGSCLATDVGARSRNLRSWRRNFTVAGLGANT